MKYLQCASWQVRGLCLSALCLLGVIWGWAPAYLTFTVDDSFYYFETAARLALGQGATFDGVEPTDGFHPLWLWILTGISWLTHWGTQTGMRVVLSIQVLAVTCSTVFLAHVSPRRLPWLPLCVALCWSAFYGAKVLVNGQESALQWTLLSCTLAVAGRTAEQVSARRSWAWGTGLLAGLCALARLESALFALAIVVSFLLTTEKTAERHTGGKRATWALIGFLGVFLPFLAFHYFQTGHWGPVSGAIKLSRVAGISPAVRVGAATVLTVTMVAICRRFRRHSDFLRLLPLISYVMGLQLYLMTVRGVWVPGIWYLTPHLLLACLVASLWVFPQQPVSSVPSWGLRGVGLAFWVLFCVSQWLYRVTPDSYARYAIAANIGQWIDTHIGANERLGGWDSGIVGAHTGRSVANLDGLINSWQYKTEYLDFGRTEQYLSERKINHVVQYFRRSWIDAGQLHWRGVDLSKWSVLKATCYEQRVVGRFWKVSPQVFLVLKKRDSKSRLLSYAGNWERLCEMGTLGTSS